MASYDKELLAAAEALLQRPEGKKGRLSSARVRRSISTSYYALFHFLLEEASLRLIGAGNSLRLRRRTFARLFSHGGIEAALSKVRGVNVDLTAVDLLRPASGPSGRVLSPEFAREMAKTFSGAKAKRHDADYHLNKRLIALDARLSLARASEAIALWRGANTAGDRDFKHALCMLMLMKGKLRQDF